MRKMESRRDFKNSVFVELFNDKARLLELYNAIEGTSYDDPNQITINTLKGVLYHGQYNDISFTLGDKIVVLIEHQSTINQNMPLRALMYIAKIYEIIVDQDNLHNEALVKIPRPEFIVLYNGFDEYPDEKTLNLSEAFSIAEDKKNQTQLELQVRVLNINKGRNTWIGEKSENLLNYSDFMDKIREYMLQGLNRDEAIEKAILYCKSKKILLDFLRENASRILGMLRGQFKPALYKKFWKEQYTAEGIAEGIAIGEEKGKTLAAQEIFSLLEKGLSLAEVKAKFSTPTA